MLGVGLWVVEIAAVVGGVAKKKHTKSNTNGNTATIQNGHHHEKQGCYRRNNTNKKHHQNIATIPTEHHHDQRGVYFYAVVLVVRV